MHIVVAGNIGSGKPTLTQMLSDHYGWSPQFESVTYNPYLEDYYKDIARWSFPMEVYFLKERFRDMLQLQSTDTPVIQDRSIFEGVYIFAANNHAQGNMSDRDFNTYMELFQLMITLTHKPDLMIYLRATVSHLVSNIQQRGRDYEQSIHLDYLKGLNEAYERFVFNDYPGRFIVIDKDNSDFLHNPRDFAAITNRIDSELFGLFNTPS
ncbi:MAG: deoxynucleoside kinase [Bacteroidales bacterium]|nr:deoxynucleoside kinase [Candidatus Equimonas enterica]